MRPIQVPATGKIAPVLKKKGRPCYRFDYVKPVHQNWFGWLCHIDLGASGQKGS